MLAMLLIRPGRPHWLRPQVCGVLQVMVGSGLPILWWGWPCHPSLRFLFTTAYFATGAVCVAVRRRKLAGESCLAHLAPAALQARGAGRRGAVGVMCAGLLP